MLGLSFPSGSIRQLGVSSETLPTQMHTPYSKESVLSISSSFSHHRKLRSLQLLTALNYYDFIEQVSLEN